LKEFQGLDYFTSNPFGKQGKNEKNKNKFASYFYFIKKQRKRMSQGSGVEITNNKMKTN